MKNILLVIAVVGLLVFGMIGMADAAPVFYTFEGTVTSIVNRTNSPYQININDKLQFVYMADDEHQAWAINGLGIKTQWTDGIYEKFFETTRLSPPYMTDEFNQTDNDPILIAEYHYGHAVDYPTSYKEVRFVSGSSPIQTALNFDGYASLSTLNVGAKGTFVEMGWFKLNGQQNDVLDEFRGNVSLTSINVAPEPISSILFITGGTLLAGRRYLRKA